MTNKPLLVSLIIVNRNGKKWLPDLLASIQKQSYSPIETILVDNGSTDDSIAMLEQEYPWVLVRRQQNFGFGSAVNLGVREAHGTYVAFLNEDMKLAPDMVEKLVDFFSRDKDGEYGIVVATEANYDGLIVHRSGGMLSDIFLNCSEAPTDYPVSAPFFYAPGSPCFMRLETFNIVGGFDDSYFLYYEDTDLSWRLRLLGYSIGICPEAVVYHAGGGSTRRTSYLVPYLKRRNQLSVMLKNYSGKSLAFVLPVYLIYLPVISLIHLVRLEYKQALIEVPAIFGALARLTHTLRQRRLVQGTRKVSDDVIVTGTRSTRPTRLLRPILLWLSQER